MDADPNTYEDFEEFDDLILDAPFEEQDPSNDETPRQSIPSTTQQTQSQTSERRRRKKVPKRRESSYTLQSATEESNALFNDCINEVATDDFVVKLTTPRAEAIRTYVRGIQDRLATSASNLAMAKFCLLLGMIWPAVAASEGKANESLRRQSMVAKWHGIRCAQQFVDAVNLVFTTLLSTDELPPLHFVQLFGQKLFDRLVLKHEAVLPRNSDMQQPHRLSTLEENALRYVAGYIVAKLKRKISKFAEGDICDQLIAALTTGSEKSTRLNYTKEWVTKQSRGGLILVNDTTFLFFRKLEEHVFFNLPKTTAQLRGIDIRAPMQASALQDRELLDKWTYIARGIVPASVSLDIFQCIIDFYIQIRGHSFASVIVEKYKQSEKTHQKGAKGLRSTLKQKSGEKIK